MVMGSAVVFLVTLGRDIYAVDILVKLGIYILIFFIFFFFYWEKLSCEHPWGCSEIRAVTKLLLAVSARSRSIPPGPCCCPAPMGLRVEATGAHAPSANTSSCGCC